MNGLRNHGRELATNLVKCAQKNGHGNVDVILFPPYTLLSDLHGILNSSWLGLGAQDCHLSTMGAHTGDIAAEMLSDLGCDYVIVGHSERRSGSKETNGMVRAKATAVQDVGMTAIICIGESSRERDAGQTLHVVSNQLEASLPKSIGGHNTIVAYEPVWAIGTGLTPSLKDIEMVHTHLRKRLLSLLGDAGSTIRLIYGGSVSALNSSAILGISGVDGALIGGASLNAADFWSIVETAR